MLLTVGRLAVLFGGNASSRHAAKPGTTHERVQSSEGENVERPVFQAVNR